MTFETERLLLRPWEEADAEALYELAKDPNIGPRAGWPIHTSVENSREIIKTVLSSGYAVILKEENKIVGCIGLVTGKTSKAVEENNEVEIGYWAGVPYWGRGLIPEAVSEMLRYIFEEIGMKKAWCGYFEGNEQSKRVQEKCGFLFHHTIENVKVLSEKDVRREYVTCLTKEQWEADRLKRQFDFIREIDKEKLIKRQTYLSNGIRKENDAEHAWHMAVMTVLLCGYANQRFDVLKTVTMLLIHDIVEIDAGDTYAYDEEGKKTQRQREEKAADRIFGLLPEDQRKKMRDLWEEFETGETPEAKFARTMDHIQPILLNDASGGKSWEEHEVRLNQILERNQNTASGSEKLWDYTYRNLIMPNVVNGKIKKEDSGNRQ